MARGKGRLPPRPDKADLPEKICPACRRPFAWRKKWARDWEQVRFCSERCRRHDGKSLSEAGPG